MPVVELEPEVAIALCHSAHLRLFTTVAGLEDHVARRSSRLPGWSVGHVLAHLARNADGHVRRLEAAMAGREVARYPGGPDQRSREIVEGAGRPAQELVLDVRESALRLELAWAASLEAGWPNAEMLAGDHFPTTASPMRRLREVEVHHVDLGLGYEPADWPDAYVQWELGASVERLPGRLADRRDAHRFLAWLTGRGDLPQDLRLTPWL